MDYKMHEHLTCRTGVRLWSIWSPAPVQIKQIKKVRELIAAEHEAACKSDDLSDLDTGVLLGALNLIDDLLDKNKKVLKL